MLAKHWWVKSNYPDAKVVVWKVSGQSLFAGLGSCCRKICTCASFPYTQYLVVAKVGGKIYSIIVVTLSLPSFFQLHLVPATLMMMLWSHLLCLASQTKKTCSQHFFIQLLHKSTLQSTVTNKSTCTIPNIWKTMDKNLPFSFQKGHSRSLLRTFEVLLGFCKLGIANVRLLGTVE